MNTAHESAVSPSESPAKASWVIVAVIAVAAGIVSGLLGLMLGTLSRPSNGQYLESVARADSAEHELAGAKRSLEDAEELGRGLRASIEAKDRLVAEEKTRAERLSKDLSKLKTEAGIPDWANPEAIAAMEKENKELQRKLTAVERTLASTKEQRNRLQEEHDERLRKNVAKSLVSERQEQKARTSSRVMFSGNGTKSTESFSTKSASWKVEWESEGEIMISVRSENEKIIEIINSENKTDSSVVRSKPGRYYLHVIGSGNWKVAVQE